MKTKLFFTFLIVSSYLNSFAQDTIYKTNGIKIIAKVMEINSSSIKYKFSGSDHDVDANIPKVDVAYIVYANGMKEVYNNSASKKQTGLDDSPERFADHNYQLPFRNIIAINCFEMFFTDLSLSYERISKSGKYSIKIPVSVGLNGKPNTNSYTSGFLTGDQFFQNRLYSGGVEFNVYPFGQTRSTFYLGVSAVAGSFVYYKSVTSYPYSGSSSYSYNNYTYVNEKHIGSQYAGMFHLGGYLGLSTNFLIGAKLGLGFKKEETVDVNYTEPKVQLDLNLAYRF